MNPPHAHAHVHKDPPHVTAFIQMVLSAAKQVKQRWGIPVAVLIAQSALETGWGRHVIGNAYFGIKGKAPDGKTTSFGTSEVIHGKTIHIKDNFRAYTGFADSADDYGRFLSENPRYKTAFAFKMDPESLWRPLQWQAMRRTQTTRSRSSALSTRTS